MPRFCTNPQPAESTPQAHQAQLFEATHQEALATAGQHLAKALALFLSQPQAQAVFTPAERADMLEMPLNQALPLLRARAVQVGRHGSTDRYWTLVDAICFYLDSMSTRWPYLGQQQRARYLSWAEEMAADLIPPRH